MQDHAVLSRPQIDERVQVEGKKKGLPWKAANPERGSMAAQTTFKLGEQEVGHSSPGLGRLFT